MHGLFHTLWIVVREERGESMKRNKVLRGIFLSLFVVMIGLAAASLYAADAENKDDQYLGGRIWEKFRFVSDGKYDEINKPIEDIPVHIVNLDTGVAFDTQTNSNGCYIFKNIPVGTYSLSVTLRGKDYPLAEKIKVEKDQKVFACAESSDKDWALGLTTEVHQKKNHKVDNDKCHCKEFPLLWIFAGAGGAAAGIIIGKGGEEEASPSTP